MTEKDCKAEQLGQEVLSLYRMIANKPTISRKIADLIMLAVASAGDAGTLVLLKTTFEEVLDVSPMPEGLQA